MFFLQLQRPGFSPFSRRLALLDPTPAGAASVPVVGRNWSLLVFMLKEGTGRCAAQPGFSPLPSVGLAAFAAQRSGLGLTEPEPDWLA